MQDQPSDRDLFSPRDAQGRFAKGGSGNPKGRPRGIRHPRCRLRDLCTDPADPAALVRLIERKPYLLRRLAAQLLPPALSYRRRYLTVGVILPPALSYRTTPGAGLG